MSIQEASIQPESPVISFRLLLDTRGIENEHQQQLLEDEMARLDRTVRAVVQGSKVDVHSFGVCEFEEWCKDSRKNLIHMSTNITRHDEVNSVDLMGYAAYLHREMAVMIHEMGSFVAVQWVLDSDHGEMLQVVEELPKEQPLKIVYH